MSPGASVAVATWYSNGWNREGVERAITLTRPGRGRGARAARAGRGEAAEPASDDHDVWWRPVCHDGRLPSLAFPPDAVQARDQEGDGAVVGDGIVGISLDVRGFGPARLRWGGR